jgi:single-stranded-DNA-specific exonuclease
MGVPYLWERLACNEEAAAGLAAALGISPAVARLLTIRGISEPDLAHRFLHPSLDHLHDPFELADMAVAVDRILAAIERKEKIAIHGDYDVDGITSTVILRRALELFGAEVIHFIPDRMKDGYGLQPETFDRLQAEGVRLVISVDCGIRADEAARRARELGVDLIITDHHEPGASLPAALAVINPKRHDCTYPDKNLAGVGVALKLVQALCRKRGRDGWMPAFVKVAALGTLADVVPLVGENRIIAKLGLDLLSQGPHKVGLRALLDVAGLTGKSIDGGHVSFLIAPRVNAAGRMASPDIAARLLLAADETMAAEAQELANQLNDENTRRQTEEPGFLRRPKNWWRPIRPSAPAASSLSGAKDGTAASLVSWRRSSWMLFTVPRSCFRLTATWLTGRAGASATSISSARWSVVRGTSSNSAATSRRPA